jgi:hypothetical protein
MGDWVLRELRLLGVGGGGQYALWTAVDFVAGGIAYQNREM